MSETLELYDYWRSSAAYRVRIGLNLKGLGYASHPVNLAPGASEQLSEAYRAVNPQQRVPTLVTGAGALGQSLAILEWLDETCPEPPLLPADPWLRAEARAFALSIACEIHPMGNLSVLRQLGQQFGAGEGSCRPGVSAGSAPAWRRWRRSSPPGPPAPTPSAIRPAWPISAWSPRPTTAAGSASTFPLSPPLRRDRRSRGPSGLRRRRPRTPTRRPES